MLSDINLRAYIYCVAFILNYHNLLNIQKLLYNYNISVIN